MAHIDELLRYDGRRVVVTGAASGIGAQLCGQLRDLGAEVVGLDVRRPATEPSEFIEIDLADSASIDQAASVVGDRIDGLFNVAGVSSGIGNPLLVVTINFLGARALTEALLPKLGPGSSIVCVSSLAAANYRDNLPQAAALLATGSMAEGIAWCQDNPDALADGGYRLSKEAIIGYTVTQAVPLAAKGIRINCTGPGVTETPILDQIRSRYGPGLLDDIPKPLGRLSDPDEQAAVLAFLGSRAAGYITGQVIWVDGGNVAARHIADYERG